MMSEIPVQLSMLAASPVLVSMLLLTVGLLLPGCPCCGDDCGQDVYDEVYVTYSGSYQLSNESISFVIGYFDKPFPDHLYAPVRILNESNRNSDGFFFSSPIPELEIGGSGVTNTAPLIQEAGTGYSISTSGSVACINVGRTRNAAYPDKEPNAVNDLWRYVFNANYGGLGCESNGVDVEVAAACPQLNRAGDKWTVSCYWCAGTSSQLSTHGNSSAPTAPRIPSLEQRSQERALVFPVEVTGITTGDPWSAAVRKSQVIGQPDLPSPHEDPTEETIGTVWRLGAVIFTEFDFNSQPKQTTTLNASIRFPRPDYLVDAAETIANGGSTLMYKLNPCSGSSCPTQVFSPQLTISSFWNSSWRAYAANPFGGVVGQSFFRIVGEESAPTGPNSEPEDWYILKKLRSGFVPVALSGASSPGSTTSNAQITLDFP